MLYPIFAHLTSLQAGVNSGQPAGRWSPADGRRPLIAGMSVPYPGSVRGPRDPRNFPGSEWLPSSSPPVAFPVYGLDASWPGARWLDLFGDEIGDPPRWVALGHQTVNGQSLIMVNTYSGPPTDAQAARSGQPPGQDVAFDAAHRLINLTLPVQSVPRPDGFLPLLTERAVLAAGQHARWPAVRWTVDAVTVAARVWRFAGGWAAVSDAVDDVYLSAVGVGARPEGLSLTRLRDGRAYHVDLAQPLLPGLLSASRQAAGAQFDEPEWKRRAWHADHARLIRALPSAGQ
jgi:hypothetical protein